AQEQGQRGVVPQRARREVVGAVRQALQGEGSVRPAAGRVERRAGGCTHGGPAGDLGRGGGRHGIDLDPCALNGRAVRADERARQALHFGRAGGLDGRSQVAARREKQNRRGERGGEGG